MNRYLVRFKYTYQGYETIHEVTDSKIIDAETKEKAEEMILNWGKAREYTFESVDIKQSKVDTFSIVEATNTFGEQIISTIEGVETELPTRPGNETPYPEKMEFFSRYEFNDELKQKTGYNGLMGFSYERVEDFVDANKQCEYKIDHYETF